MCAIEKRRAIQMPMLSYQLFAKCLVMRCCELATYIIIIVICVSDLAIYFSVS